MTHLAHLRLLASCCFLLGMPGCPLIGDLPDLPGVSDSVEDTLEDVSGETFDELDVLEEDLEETDLTVDPGNPPKGDPSVPDPSLGFLPTEEGGDGFIECEVGLDVDFDVEMECGVGEDTDGTYLGPTFGCMSFEVDGSAEFHSVCIQPLTLNGVFQGVNVFVANSNGTRNDVFFPGAANVEVLGDRNNTTFQFFARVPGTAPWIVIDSSELSAPNLPINLSIGVANLPLNGSMYFDGLQVNVPINWPPTGSPRENEQNLIVAGLELAEAQDLLEGPNPNLGASAPSLLEANARLLTVASNLASLPKSPDKTIEKARSLRKKYLATATKSTQSAISAHQKNKKPKVIVGQLPKAILNILNAARTQRALAATDRL
ncbi:MAG: hypothetical protein ACKVS6_14100 [Planctomycetota bacterium]